MDINVNTDNMLLSYCNNCRICLQINQQVTPIQLLKELNDFDVLLTFFNIEVMADKRYSNGICVVCLNQLRNIILFKQKCESSFNYLKNILNDDGFRILPIQIGNLFDNDKSIKIEDTEENDFDQDTNIDEISSEAVNTDVKTEKFDTTSFSCNKCKRCKYTSETCSCINSHKKSADNVVGESKAHSNLPSEKKTKNRFKCEYCLKLFQNEDLLTRHIRIHLGLKPFPCDECSRSYSRKARLIFHKKLYHNDKPPQKETCQKCGASVLYLAVHNSIKHSKHSIKHKVECQYCGKKFTYNAGLRYHVKHFHENRTEPRHVLCTLCGKIFNQMCDLNKHNKANHSNERHYQCRHCDKRFKTSNARYNHEKSHLNHRRYKCTYCPKAFNQKKTLENHIRIHTGEKPLSCSICSKAFRQGATLHNHLRLVHGRASIK